MRQDGRSLQFTGEALKSDKEIVQAALGSRPGAIEYAGKVPEKHVATSPTASPHRDGTQGRGAAKRPAGVHRAVAKKPASARRATAKRPAAACRGAAKKRRFP